MVNQRILVLTCICHIVSVLLFMYGYFPNKSFNSARFSTVNDIPATEPGLNFKADVFYRRHVGKVVLIVIDALRADFIFDKQHTNSMPYLQNLLKNKQAFGVTGRATPPTVTLPRIKAITTGTVPGYIDVVMNFGAPALSEDSLLYQSKKRGLSTVFYGDDTWIRLFPTNFKRKDGTTSFFVTDFKEVDDNVTRHLNSELHKNDWDLLILHYLGLDHIGHVVGPKSPIVSSKLQEMDNVIKLIHSTLISKTSNNSLPPLVVICGDHGMNDAGSHGGSSAKETEIPLLFTMPLNDSEIKNLPKFGNVLQVDLTASLAMLLGLPIPQNNLGKIIPALLSNLDWRQRLYLSYVNAVQIYQVALRSGLSNLDEIYLGFYKTKEKHRIWLMRCSVEMFKYGKNFYVNLWCVVALVLHSVSLASSSFVEEEHYTWYYITSSIILILIYLLVNKLTIDFTRKLEYVRQAVQLVIVLLLFRIGRNWNSTGDHWVQLEDIGDWLSSGKNSPLLLLSGVTFGLILVPGIRMMFHQKLVNVLVFSVALLIFIYRAKTLVPTMLPILETIPSNYVARVVFVLNAVICVYGLSARKRSDKISTLQEYLLTNTQLLKELSIESTVLLRLFLAKSAFFQQGNSNNLARIDLVGGYIGLDNYHPTIIGILLICSTYSSSIFWLCSICSHIYASEPQRFSRNLLKASLVLLATQALIWSFYTVFAFILRYHLFVWTVFSPKLLFEESRLTS
ncbi:hypothetical protein CHUAL_006450 [Chamberlinius hualienensis]